MGPRISSACARCKLRKRKCDGRVPCRTCVQTASECIYRNIDGRKFNKREQFKTLVQQNENLLKFIEKNVLTKLPHLSDEVKDIISENRFSLQSVKDESSDELPGDEIADIISDRISESIAAKDLTPKWDIHLDSNGKTVFIGPSSNTTTLLESLKEKSEDNHPNFEIEIEQFLENCFLDNHLIEWSLQTLKLNIGKFFYILEDIDFESVVSLGKVPNQITSLKILLCCIISFSLNFNNSSRYAGHQYLLSKFIQRNLLTILRDTALGRCKQDTFNNLCSLIILIGVELGNSNDFLCWLYNSLLACHVQHLGLHISVGPHFKSKLFWTAVMVDRIISNVLGRNNFISSQSIMSHSYDYGSSSPSLDEIVFKYNTKLWSILNLFMDQIYTYRFEFYTNHRKNELFQGSTGAMDELYISLPKELQIDISNVPTNLNPSVLLFHIQFFMSSLLQLKPFVCTDEFGKQAMLRCLEKGENVIRIIQVFNNSITSEYCPLHYSYMLFGISVFQLLVLLQPYSILIGMKEKFFYIVRTLKYLSGQWKKAEEYLRGVLTYACRWNIDSEIIEEIKSILFSEMVVGLDEFKTMNASFFCQIQELRSIENEFVPLDYELASSDIALNAEYFTRI